MAQPTPEDIATYFLQLDGRRKSADRLEQTAGHFGLDSALVQKQLKFWLSGEEYLRHFPRKKPRAKRHPVYTRSAADLIQALNQSGGLVAAATALGCSPATLKGAMEEKGIGRVYGILKSR